MNKIRAPLPQRNVRGFTLMEIILVMGIFSTAVLMVMTIVTTSSKVQYRTIVSQRLTADARYTVETIARTIRSGRLDYDFHYGLNGWASPTDTATLDAPAEPMHVLSILDQDGNRTIFRRQCLNGDPDDPYCQRSDAEAFLGDSVEVCLERNICIGNDGYGDGSGAVCNRDGDCGQGETCELSCDYPEAWNNITPSGVRLTGGASHPDEPYGLKFVIQPVTDPFTYFADVPGGGYLSNQQPRITVILVTKGTEGPEEERKTTIVQTTVIPRSYIR